MLLPDPLQVHGWEPCHCVGISLSGPHGMSGMSRDSHMQNLTQ